MLSALMPGPAINGSLTDLITKGKGKPNAKDELQQN
jgi:hypothetical protein